MTVLQALVNDREKGKAMKRIIVLCLLSSALVLGSAATSFAKSGGNTAPLSVTCNGTSYDVTIVLGGEWAAARDNNSTLVFHPTAFGETTRTFYPADGSTPQTQTEPPSEFQAQQQNGHPRVECTFHLELTNQSGTRVDDGSVSGWVS